MTPTDVDGWIVVVWWLCCGSLAVFGGLWAVLLFCETVCKVLGRHKGDAK